MHPVSEQDEHSYQSQKYMQAEKKKSVTVTGPEK
jgi:hypothetical protein